MSYEFKRLLVDIAYTNLGLVPPSHYPWGEVGSLENSLSSLGCAHSRKSKRKFRKILRRSRKGKKGDWARSSYNCKQSAVRAYVTRKHLHSDFPDNDE